MGLRNDTGALWENFMVSERQKYLLYTQQQANVYFWRTTAQQEIDYIEETNGTLSAYEFKWNPTAKAKFSQTFMGNYDVSQTAVITPQNYQHWLNGAL